MSRNLEVSLIAFAGGAGFFGLVCLVLMAIRDFRRWRRRPR